MNKLTETIKEKLVPKAALIAYSNEGTSGKDAYFLEMRTIDTAGRMGAGMPITYDFMNTLATSFSESHNGIPHGPLPPNLLYADTRRGSERYVWYNVPRRRMMYFTKSLNIENAEYHVPGLVYVAAADRLHLYAFKGEVPDGSTELYRAPFFNIYDTGVCLGNAKLDRPDNPSFGDLLDHWEQKFWLTEFSHLGGSGNPTKSNLVLVTKAAKDKPFDPEELILHGNLKLKDLMR